MSGVINQARWGICGFVSVLNALYQDGKLKEFGKDLSLDQIHVRLGAELITYLKMTSVERPAIAAEILSFTQSFGPPYSGYTSINDICRRIATEVQTIQSSSDWTNNQGGIGVGMPVAAVQDYVKFVGLTSTLKTVTFLSFTKDELLANKGCILGLGREPRGGQQKGLRHWVYVDQQGCLLNWATKTDLAKSGMPGGLNFDFICYAVELG